MAKIKYLPFPEFWETMLQTVYKDKTITGLSVVVSHGKGNAEIYHTGDMDEMELMELSFRASTRHLHALLDEVRKEHADEGYTWDDYERDFLSDDGEDDEDDDDD